MAGVCGAAAETLSREDDHWKLRLEFFPDHADEFRRGEVRGLCNVQSMTASVTDRSRADGAAEEALAITTTANALFDMPQLAGKPGTTMFR